MASVRDEAEMLALGLELGVVRPAEVVEWADGVIARSELVHWSIGELVTMGRAYEQDVAAALRRIPGEPNLAWANVALVRRLPQHLRARRELDEPFIEALVFLRGLDERGLLVDPELRQATRPAWRALGLMGQLWLGEQRERLVDELLTALDAAIARLP